MYATQFRAILWVLLEIASHLLLYNANEKN